MRVTLCKVTIVAESLLQNRLVRLIRDSGATGYTLTRAEGEGGDQDGVRASDWEGRHLRFETLVSQEVADRLVDALADTYFDDYAVIAWLTEVQVLRGKKFIRDSA